MTPAHLPPPIPVLWEGPLFVHHSFGMVNRELLFALSAEPRLDVRILRTEPDQFAPSVTPPPQLLGAPHPHPAVHIRHQFPPVLSPPPHGRYVLFQPWEFGSLPQAWHEHMLRHVHETWVYSQYLKACYVNDGLPPEKIHVIPLGVNPALFRPDAPPLAAIQAATGECFRFLFSGGATPRKGVDLLVNAYLAEFRTHEPVCLVIKDGGNYPPEMGRQIEAVAAHPGHARILYTRKSLNPQELAGLYTACHCYVHPYRSEGYGLPIAEAMACGLPVIVTGGGACLDFTSAHEVSYIPSTVRRLPERSFEGVPTVGNPYWLEPDLPSLRRLMRRAYTSYAELREKAILTSVRIRTGHTWVQSAAAVKARLFARL